MNFREVVNLIEAVANAVNPGGHFLYGREYDATKDYKKKWPQIHLYPIKQNKKRGADHIDYTEVLLCFFDQDKEANTIEERAEITYRMEDLSRAFENTLRTQKVEIDGLNKDIQYRKLMADATGVSLKLVFASAAGCEPVTMVCAPATVTLNSEFLTTINSGAGKNILLINQNDEQVIPLTITDGPLQTSIKVETGGPVRVSNSDDSYVEVVEGPGDLELPDTTYNFYIAGNPIPVIQVIPSLKDETLNVIWQ